MDIKLYNQLQEHVTKDDINVNFVPFASSHMTNSGRRSTAFLYHVSSVYTPSSYKLIPVKQGNPTTTFILHANKLRMPLSHKMCSHLQPPLQINFLS